MEASLNRILGICKKEEPSDPFPANLSAVREKNEPAALNFMETDENQHQTDGFWLRADEKAGRADEFATSAN
ncbi:MAG: hypothetical protein ABIT76_05220 [Chthoniobacterales bacterium]